jgi:hypothetical protein
VKVTDSPAGMVPPVDGGRKYAATALSAVIDAAGLVVTSQTLRDRLGHVPKTTRLGTISPGTLSRPAPMCSGSWKFAKAA